MKFKFHSSYSFVLRWSIDKRAIARIRSSRKSKIQSSSSPSFATSVVKSEISATVTARWDHFRDSEISFNSELMLMNNSIIGNHSATLQHETFSRETRSGSTNLTKSKKSSINSFLSFLFSSISLFFVRLVMRSLFLGICRRLFFLLVRFFLSRVAFLAAAAASAFFLSSFAFLLASSSSRFFFYSSAGDGPLATLTATLGASLFSFSPKLAKAREQEEEQEQEGCS